MFIFNILFSFPFRLVTINASGERDFFLSIFLPCSMWLRLTCIYCTYIYIFLNVSYEFYVCSKNYWFFITHFSRRHCRRHFQRSVTLFLLFLNFNCLLLFFFYIPLQYFIYFYVMSILFRFPTGSLPFNIFFFFVELLLIILELISLLTTYQSTSEFQLVEPTFQLISIRKTHVLVCRSLIKYSQSNERMVINNLNANGAKREWLMSIIIRITTQLCMWILSNCLVKNHQLI